jgi:hypothetical protein
VWLLRSVMDWRDKDYQSPAQKKAPVQNQCDDFMVCVNTTSIGVSMAKTVTGVGLHLYFSRTPKLKNDKVANIRPHSVGYILCYISLEIMKVQDIEIQRW